MKVMTLNLNSYQEENQIEKFRRIADKVVELNVDAVCLCEASQRITSETYNNYVRDDNAVKLICDYINEKSKDNYEFAWDFSHYGFKIYEEGIGIITRHPILEVVTKYVSKTHDIFTFKSRKIMRTKIDFNGEEVYLYSIQLGWVDDNYEPFDLQFERLDEWVKENEEFSILAGDFGNDVSTNAYQQILEAGYIDQYVSCNKNGLKDDTFINPDGWEYQTLEPLRLDYIFTNNNKYNAVNAEVLFDVDNRVSDHKAVYIEFAKNNEDVQ